ncbi:MAG: hypothetical protein LBG90_02395 [Spirochaetaceae bacterium]|jgi:Rad3-related DNA helicase|nr:hypothetical protein [Spirochaetaceae bacterium]
MEILEKYIDASPYKKIFVKGISELTETQKSELENLVIRLEKAGAKNPLQWAFSEIKENIPQFGRFLVLKRLFEITKSPKENVSMASDFDDEIEDKFSEISKIIGEEKFLDFLLSFSKGIMYNVTELFDEGNRNMEEDKVNWILLKTDENGKHSEQIIQGLHEDFLEFENEIKIIK